MKSGQHRPDEFFHAEGGAIVSPAGETAVLRGMGFGNNVWVSSQADIGFHHNEDSFREMSELGFNSVRFLLNYRWFEDDETRMSTSRRALITSIGALPGRRNTTSVWC